MRYRVVGRFGVTRNSSSGRSISTEPEGGAWVRVTAVKERHFAVSAVPVRPDEQSLSDADLAAVLAALEEANEAADRVLKAADDSAHAFNAGLLELKEAREILAASNRQAESRRAEESAACP